MSGSIGDNKWQVEIQVDGEPVELNRTFIHEMIGASLEGLVSALRGVEEPSSIEISAVRTVHNDHQQ